jgi:hypothetical protein
VLFGECRYDGDGNLLNANMADYLVPMAGGMPDIAVGHVETPTRESELGAKGAGEAGTAGAPAAVLNAINDALAPLKLQGHDTHSVRGKCATRVGRAGVRCRSAPASGRDSSQRRDAGPPKGYRDPVFRRPGCLYRRSAIAATLVQQPCSCRKPAISSRNMSNARVPSITT